MKTCPKCRVRNRNGKGPWCSQCSRDYNRVYMKQRRQDPSFRDAEHSRKKTRRQARLNIVRAQDREFARSNQEWINSIKDKPCADCGKTFPSCCMDFDHVRGKKFKGIGRMVGFSEARILEEIAKCDVVCACCHRVRTHPHREASGNPSRRRFYEKIDHLKEPPCSDCGLTFSPVAMDFDHVRGEKVATIAQMRSFAWASVLVELRKCDLVCACCHRIRTHSRLVLRAA